MIPCNIFRAGDYLVGLAEVPVGRGSYLVREFVDVGAEEERIFREVLQRDLARLGQQFGVAPFEVGFFGKIFKKAKAAVKSVVNNAKLVAKAVVNKEARKKLVNKIKTGVKKVAKVAKKVYTHPVFAGAVAAVSVTVPGAQGLGVAYGLSRAGIAMAEKIAAGDPSAIAAAAEITLQAVAQHNPKAQVALKYLEEGKKIVNGDMSSVKKIAGEVNDKLKIVPPGAKIPAYNGPMIQKAPQGWAQFKSTLGL